MCVLVLSWIELGLFREEGRLSSTRLRVNGLTCGNAGLWFCGMIPVSAFVNSFLLLFPYQIGGSFSHPLVGHVFEP